MADLDELKATQEQVIAAVNRRDLDGWLALMHDDVIYRNAFAPFAVAGKAALRQVAAAQLSRSESLRVTLINLQYRVFERTGIVCGHSILRRQTERRPAADLLSCATPARTRRSMANGGWQPCICRVFR